MASSTPSVFNNNNRTNKRKATYLGISRACFVCKRDHKACNGGRPCSRCIAAGMSDRCQDVALKTRGRPRKKRFGETELIGEIRLNGESLQDVFDDFFTPSYPPSKPLPTNYGDGQKASAEEGFSFYITSFPTIPNEVQQQTSKNPDRFAQGLSERLKVIHDKLQPLTEQNNQYLDKKTKARKKGIPFHRFHTVYPTVVRQRRHFDSQRSSSASSSETFESFAHDDKVDSPHATAKTTPSTHKLSVQFLCN